ncbi:MAG TPA: DNA-3-methyladenine glycosylase [Elusimicrobia bacterium]|nr:MAG: hypothetical protein A2X40_06340 [Elusimicrobia bacterium GWC2_65_9]HAZ07152.1 DNA-3-methyladenine glycosylase [Elusimicrobiota bacterium]
MKARGDRVAGTLPRSWYARDTVAVARELLGKILVVRSRPAFSLEDPRSLTTAARIVETEAYHGDDPASHSARGPTPRCRVMFGEAGTAYVYFVYGMHELLNFVTERPGYPGAVLVRAVAPLEGESLMRRRRGGLPPRQWTSGPGRLCRAMGVRLAHGGAPLTGPVLFVVDDGFVPGPVMVSRRVGISAGRRRPWRFFLQGDPFVSRVPENAGARRL